MISEAPKAIVIGAGFAGLSAAAYLGKAGYQVRIIEKNAQTGGRARTLQVDGFHFDMGPSWYWMPDVFDRFFADFGKKTSDYYTLHRLSPSYRVFFPEGECMDIPDNAVALEALFEQLEPGSGEQLRRFLKDAQFKYESGMMDLVHKPGNHLLEFADWRVFKGMFRLNLLTPFSRFIRKYFSHPRLLQLLEFPVLFLGAQPKDIPALYSLMNYADMVLGTWYPMGGMHQIVDGMQQIAIEQGVVIQTGEELTGVDMQQQAIKRVITTKGSYEADVVIGSADYHHLEQEILPQAYRQYTEAYWDQRTLAPSCIIFYLGLDQRIDGLLHHNLFFDTDFDRHARQIYAEPQWPDAPLFYVSATSKTDPGVAPQGCENLFVLIPVAPGLDDTDAIRQQYFELVMSRLEARTGQDIRKHVIVRKDYGKRAFVQDYHSYKGNAYGLANTLRQTAILKPKMKSSKVKNLYYTGQLTVPGPGVPPSLISGKIAAQQIISTSPVYAR